MVPVPIFRTGDYYFILIQNQYSPAMRWHLLITNPFYMNFILSLIFSVYFFLFLSISFSLFNLIVSYRYLGIYLQFPIVCLFSLQKTRQNFCATQKKRNFTRLCASAPQRRTFRGLSNSVITLEPVLRIKNFFSGSAQTFQKVLNPLPYVFQMKHIF